MYVPDVDASISFYEKAFGFKPKFITPEGDYGELISGATTIAFARESLADSNLPSGYIKSDITERPFAIELGFTTDNPSEVIDKAVDEGAILEEPIVTKSWGQEVGYIRDPNGFLIEICSPMQA